MGQGSALPHALNPTLAETRDDRAKAMWLTGKVLEAIAEYKPALRLRPGYPEARNNLEHLLERIGDSGGRRLCAGLRDGTVLSAVRGGIVT